MILKNLGWELYRKKLPLETVPLEATVARVAVENRGSYLLYSPEGELEGIMRGKFMQGKKASSAYPKVGDWVVFEKLAGEKKAIITDVLPRTSKLSRNKAGEDATEQIIAANIDVVFIVQGLDGDFNISRLQRYVAMAHVGNCQPVILLNKCDATPDAPDKLAQAKAALPGIPILLTSATEGLGVDQVRSLITTGLSLVFVGSSGAGKSTLINNLLGTTRQKTGATRLTDSKGKHTTTKRELIVLASGGVLIDTPGMRELGMWAQPETAEAETFEDIQVLRSECKFNDCDHERSQGCAIVAAVASGALPSDRYQRFLKINQEMHARQKKVWK